MQSLPCDVKTDARNSPEPPEAADLLDWALWYAAATNWRVVRQHHVLPDGTCSCGNKVKCEGRPGKHPRTLHGFNDGSTDEATIRGWCKRWPEANLAIVCDGVVVIGPDG